MNNKSDNLPERFLCRYCRKMQKGYPVRIKKADIQNKPLPFPQIPGARVIMFVDGAMRQSLVKSRAAAPLLMHMIAGDPHELRAIEQTGGYVVCTNCRKISDGVGVETKEEVTLLEGDLNPIPAGTALITSSMIARELMICGKARLVEFYFLEEKVTEI